MYSIDVVLNFVWLLIEFITMLFDLNPFFNQLASFMRKFNKSKAQVALFHTKMSDVRMLTEILFFDINVKHVPGWSVISST